MENSTNDKEMQALFDRFMSSFVESRDPRIDLEIYALKELKGAYLEKAKAAILERLEKIPSSDAMSCASAIQLTEAIPLLKRWLENIRADPANEYNRPYIRGLLAYNLYEFTKDEAYVPEVVELVKSEGYGEFNIGISCLSRMPLTEEGIAAVWNKYKKGRTVKYPNSWMESCAWFLKAKIEEPVGKSFLRKLPEAERNELIQFIGESGHQRLERKFRLEKYIYGSERYSQEEVNRYNEYIKVGGTPVKGMTLQQLWKGHTGDILGLKWSPDGRYLASYAGDDTLRIWSLDSRDGVKVFQQKKEYPYSRNEPHRIAWTSPSGERIAVEYSNYQTSSRDRYSFSEWNVPSGKLGAPLYGIPDPHPMNDLLYFFDRETFLLCYWNRLYLLDRASRQKKQILREYKGRFGSISLSSNGNIAALGYHELIDPQTGLAYQTGFSGEGVPQEVLIYELDRNRVVQRFDTGHVQGINKLCWMPGKPVLAVASSDNSISIWDLKENKRIALLESEGFVGSINGLAFSANGMLLASKSDADKLMRIWRTDKWEEVIALRQLSSYGSNFAFHPSLPILASICFLRDANDNSSDDSPVGICVWEFDEETFLSNPPFMEEFQRRETNIRAKLIGEEVTEDLEYVKVGGSPEKGFKLRQVLKGHTDRIHRISWSPDGRYLASPSDDKTIRIWEETTGTCLAVLEEQNEMKQSAWSPNGVDLVYGGSQQIKLWNPKTVKSVEILQKDFRDLHSLAFSPDGTRLALAYGYNTIQILDTSTWQEISSKMLDPRAHCSIDLRWSEDGRQIIANPYVGVIQIRDAQTLSLVGKVMVPGDHDDFYGFSFLYAIFGNKLAVAEQKKPIQIFDWRTGQLERTLGESSPYASGLCFSPDGRLLLAWCQDNAVHFWRTDTWQKVARIHEYATRSVGPAYPSFHPVKPSLVTFCDKRRSVRFWDIDYKELLG